MRGLSVIAVLGLTCLGGYLWGTRRLGLSRAGLRTAGAATLETVGLGVLFFVMNLALTVLPLLVARAWTGRFVSVYGFDDITIATVSLLQGVAFRWWRGRG